MNINQLINDEIAHVNRMMMRAHNVFSLILVTDETELLPEFVNQTVSALFPSIHPAVFPKSFSLNLSNTLTPQTVAQFLASCDLDDTDIIFFLSNASIDPISIDVGQEEVFLVKANEEPDDVMQWQLDMVMKSSANPVSYHCEKLLPTDPGFSQWIEWLVSQCDPDTGEIYDPDGD
jgi:hypothetical protein